MKKLFWLATVVSVGMLSGCANLKSVRDFAADTKKVAVAYEPIGKTAVATCIRSKTFKDDNETVLPVRDFDPDQIQKKAVEGCKTTTDALKGTQQIADVLKAYAEALGELAGDGLATRLDDDFDSLSAQLATVPGVSADKVTAVKSLVAFLTRIIIARKLDASIEEALSHEAAVGTLGDALVFVAEREYQRGYAQQLLDTMAAFSADARKARIDPLLARTQITRIADERRKVVDQRASVDQLRKTVNQMKVAMADVRANFRKTDDKTRLESILKYRQEVTALYKELGTAF